MNKGALQVKVTLDDENFDKEILALKAKLEDTQKEIDFRKKMVNNADTYALDKVSVKEFSREIIDLEAKASKLQKQLNKLNNQKLEGLRRGLKNFDNSMGKTIKKVAKFGVAIIGIESVRTIFSKALQSNEKMTKTMENAWLGLSHVLQPVFDWISDKMMYLIAIINQFIKSLTGIDLVAKGNAEALKKQADAQKKLNKETYSFDEMNISNDNSSTNNSSSSTVELPTLSEDTINKIDRVATSVKNIWEKTDGIRSILKKIADFGLKHPELIIGILGGVKLGSWIASIIGVSGGTTGLLGIAFALSVIAGISIANVISEVKDMKKVMEDSEKKFEGNTQAVENYKEKIEESSEANSYFSQTIDLMSRETTKSANGLADFFEELNWGTLRVNILSGAFKNKQKVLEESLKQEKLYAEAMDVAYEKTDKTSEQTEEYIRYLENYRDGLSEVNEKISKNSEVAYMLSDVIQSNNNEISNLNEKITSLKDGLSTTSESFTDLGASTEKSSWKLSLIKNMMDKIKSKSVTLDVNANASKAESVLKNLFNNNLSKSISGILGSLGLNIKIPKLATGAIVNNPGRGVLSNGYISGEAGKEGILPLTDASAMSQLGYEIGKWITVNNTVYNYMNGKLIQRNFNQQNEEEKFARGD